MSISLVDSRQSAVFSRMSLICAIMVVCLHVGSNDCVNTVAWWFLVVEKQICKLAVPWFFLVAGYFLVNHYGEDHWYRDSILSRVRSLALPYLFWRLMF